MANQAAPKNPAHSPNSVDTMYQVGGSLSLAMVVSEPDVPSIPAVTAAKISATIWPARNPRQKNRNHIQAEAGESGAPPAASCVPSDTSAPGRSGTDRTAVSTDGAT